MISPAQSIKSLALSTLTEEQRIELANELLKRAEKVKEKTKKQKIAEFKAYYEKHRESLFK